MIETHHSMEMASLKTICRIYDWKYDTIYKKWKRGDFVRAYRDPVGRGIRFDLKDVIAWAHQNPVEISKPSLLIYEL
jgi:hypothetical protein